MKESSKRFDLNWRIEMIIKASFIGFAWFMHYYDKVVLSKKDFVKSLATDIKCAQ